MILLCRVFQGICHDIEQLIEYLLFGCKIICLNVFSRLLNHHKSPFKVLIKHLNYGLPDSLVRHFQVLLWLIDLVEAEVLICTALVDWIRLLSGSLICTFSFEIIFVLNDDLDNQILDVRVSVLIDELHSCTSQILKVTLLNSSLKQIVILLDHPFENKFKEVHVAIILSELLHTFEKGR